jgi:hypothetical protein
MNTGVMRLVRMQSGCFERLERQWNGFKMEILQEFWVSTNYRRFYDKLYHT